MSHDIGIACRRSSEWSGLDRLGHVELQSSKRRLVITAVLAGPASPKSARTYGVSQGWISRLMARYGAEGEAAFEPRSRAPTNLTERHRRHDRRPGPASCARSSPRPAWTPAPTPSSWHLHHHHQITLSRATINRILVRAGQVSPGPVQATRSPPTSGSRPSSPTRPGSPTSPTTDSPTPTADPAPTSRSSPGSTTTPATPCTSPPTPGHRPDRADHLHPGR